MSSEEKKEIEEAVSIILRGIDIESSALILEKAIMDNYIISTGRVNILRIATRQILNFIEEYKNKGYLDVVREKVKANEEISKPQKEIELQKEKRENQKVELAILNEKQKEMNKLKNTVSSYKGMFRKQEREIRKLKKENKEKDKEIEELKQALARNIAKNFTSSMKESEKSKEDLEMLNRGWQIELERKDKIIDLIARAFKQDDVRTVEEIKKYFERKSEEC